VIALAIAAGTLFAIFRGDVTALIPLFAVGLFTAFTLSQAGMVVHWWRLRGRRWPLKMAVNALGSFTTCLVTLIVMISKFTEGAWIPTLIIPVIVVLFLGIHRHYERIGRGLAVEPGITLKPIRQAVLVLVGGRVNKGVVHAVEFALAQDAWYRAAVCVAYSDDEAAAIRDQWDAFGFDIELQVLDSPYRVLGQPVLDFIDRIDGLRDDDVMTVVIPEFVVHKWWEQILHNQSALWLKGRLHFRPNTIVVSVPVHME